MGGMGGLVLLGERGVWWNRFMGDRSLLMLGIAGPELTVEEARLFRKLQPVGYILFTRNIESAEQVRRLTDELKELSDGFEPIIAMDQEGGRVTRTKEIGPILPSAAALAERGNSQDIAMAGALTGRMLSLLGVNMNFGPVLDLDHYPEAMNALRGRCWGGESQRVIDGAGTWSRWMRRQGIANCGKHFPACGRSLVDPHHDLPVCDASWDELMADDIIPYTALMPELDAVMLAHVEFPRVDGRYPASLSPVMVQRHLRDQLGFDRHLVMTDDLDMGAIQNRYGRGEDVKLAIEAGNDFAMICHQVESAEGAARAIEQVSLVRRDEALARLERFEKKVLKPSPRWSVSEWEKVCREIAELTGKYGVGGDGQVLSPVERY